MWIDGCGAGWGEVGELSKKTNYEDLKDQFKLNYEDWSTGKINMSTGQLWRFYDEFQVGDTVLTYDSSNRIYFIGEIKSEGKESDNPLAFKYYNPAQIVAGKSMEEHLKFAVAYWHTFCGTGGDPFGPGTMSFEWDKPANPMDAAKAKADAAFEFITKMGFNYFCFHDYDLVQEADTFLESEKRLSKIVDYIKDIQASTGIKLLWGTANCFSNPRYMNGAASNPDFKVLARAGGQVKLALDATIALNGENYVFWGGRTLEENYHAENPAQRFAYDFVVHKDGKSHSGDGARLTDYHCWDRTILAPADGTVVARVDGLPDQAIGETDAQRPAGNHVVLDLGEGEFVFLAHLRRGSVTVEAGERVRSGQQIGRCGNSGNTSEPHLHMHMQTTTELAAGEGLPAQFRNYRADGVLQERGEPVRGQTVIIGD